MLNVIDKLLQTKIFYKGKFIDINQYELKNMEIFEEILENNEKINLLVAPDREVIEILLLIFYGMKLYVKNLFNDENSILNHAHKGTILYYKGKKVEYLGTQKINSKEKIHFKYGNNSEEWINVEDEYKLSIYNGDSKKLGNMSNKKSNNKKDIRYIKNILSKLLDVDLEYEVFEIKEQMVLVYPRKDKLEELLNNIEMEVEGKKYLFSEIFPCKYYSEEDRGVFLKGNKLALKEMLLFTSSMDIAIDIISNNESDNGNLLLLGEDTYSNEIGGQLDDILTTKKLKKIFILNCFDKCQNLKEVNDFFDIDLKAWTKTTLFKNIDKEEISKLCLNNTKINSFLNTKIENIISYNSLKITRKIFDLKKNLNALLNEDFSKKDEFLMAGYGLLKIFEKIVVPIEEYNRFIVKNKLSRYTAWQLKDILEKILKENKVYEYKYKMIKKIVKDVENLYGLMLCKNPKLEYLQNVDFGIDNLILCSSDIEKKILNKYEFIKKRFISVECVKKYKYFKTYDKIIFTSVYSSKKINQVYCYECLNKINILYPSEVSKYNRMVDNYNNIFKIILEKNSLDNTSEMEKLEKIKINYNEFLHYEEIEEIEIKLEKKINSYIDQIENFKYLDLEKILNTVNTENMDNNYLENKFNFVNKRINFIDRKSALLTQYYESNCLDFNNKKIIKKDINLLKKGDRLIFVDSKTKDEMTKLFYKIMSSDKFKKVYSVHYENVKYWKKELEKYIKNYFGNYELVVKEFERYNIKRTEQAIKSWIMDENIIGPTEKIVYKAIANITQNDYLLKNWEEVYKSCNLIRNLKTKLKYNFNLMVIDSCIYKKNEDEFEKIVSSVLGDLKNYAHIKEIDEILDVSINVPINKTNCILEKEVVNKFIK